MLKLLLTTAVLLGVLAAPVGASSEEPSALTAPTPAAVSVRLVSMAGSGCPGGTPSAVVLSDAAGFRVSLRPYTAQAGPNVSPLEGRKNCQLGVLISGPRGYTYTIPSVTARGYLRLAPGAVAIQQISLYIAGSPTTARISEQFRGPAARDWLVTSAVQTPISAPCNTARNLNINSEVRILSRSPSSITLGTRDPRGSMDFRLAWRRC